MIGSVLNAALVRICLKPYKAKARACFKIPIVYNMAKVLIANANDGSGEFARPLFLPWKWPFILRRKIIFSVRLFYSYRYDAHWRTNVHKTSMDYKLLQVRGGFH